MTSKSDWYTGYILDEIQKSSRKWLKNKLEEVRNTKRCEPTVK